MPTSLVKTGIEVSTYFYNGRKLIRSSNGFLWCCYTFLNIDTSRDEVWCALSTDNGEIWTNELVASNPDYHCRAPAIAMDSDGNLHMVYGVVQNIVWPHYFRIYYRKLIKGVGWEDVVLVDSDGNNPAIAIDSNDNIHIVYSSTHPDHPGCQNAKYISKVNEEWQEREWVTAITSIWGQFYINIAVDYWNNIHLTWEGTGWGANPNIYNIQYRCRTTSGWDPQEAVTDEAVAQWHSSVVVDSLSRIHVAWAYNASYRKKIPFIGWQPVETIPFTDPGDMSCIALDSFDIPYVVSEDTIAGITQLSFSKREADGWTAPEQITNRDVDSYMPVMIWATNPNGIRGSIPKSGFAVLYYTEADPMEINFYLDCVWSEAAKGSAALNLIPLLA